MALSVEASALRSVLQDRGWKIEREPISSNPDEIYAWQRLDSTVPPCFHNETPPVLCINFHSIELHGVHHDSVDFTVRGQLNESGEWVNLQVYSFGYSNHVQVLSALDFARTVLSAAWSASVQAASTFGSV